MFEVVTLGSGSAGNAALVRTERTAMLVDAGLSAKQLMARMAAFGVTPESLTGILLTHEHSDHTSALRVMLARHELPVYCNRFTARALQDMGLAHKNWQLFQNGSEFAVGDFTVSPFSVPHDAADPVGFRISAEDACFGVLTDLGYATRLVFDMLRGIRGILIETNYDEEMLQRDPRRPWSVKQRITSKHGHLSNRAAAQVLTELAAPLNHVILGHLSKDCNSPELAAESVSGPLAALGRLPGCRLHCASQSEPGPVFQII